MTIDPVGVRLFRDFQEDGRISMEIYADELAAALRGLPGAPVRVEEYVPHAALGTNRWGMRLSRYVAYPWQARGRGAALNHIAEHGYAHLLSVLEPARTVVTVHDLIPLLRWKGLIPSRGRVRRPLLSEVSLHYLRRAARLVAISESTKRDLIAHCGCQAERIAVIHFGLSPRFSPLPNAVRASLRVRHGLPANDAPVVLAAGTGFYKNHATCVSVLRDLRARGSNALLVRVGGPDSEWDAAVRASGLEEHTRDLGTLPQGDLVELYNCADCLLFPSLYEGFGWPPIEAMACGLPVVSSRAGGLAEAVGDAAAIRDPNDVRGLAEAVGEVLEDPELRASMIRRGRLQAARFSWNKNAEATLALYREVIAAR
jgi:glycosyltransferase involved in cell wall biosynthesis